MHSPRLFQGVRHRQSEEGALALPDSPQKSTGTKNGNLITRCNLQLIRIWIQCLVCGSYTRSYSQWDRWLQYSYVALSIISTLSTKISTSSWEQLWTFWAADLISPSTSTMDSLFILWIKTKSEVKMQQTSDGHMLNKCSEIVFKEVLITTGYAIFYFDGEHIQTNL